MRFASLRNSRIHDVSFALRRGEILGFAGLVGRGRSELARALFGIDPITSGEILVDGPAGRDPRPAEARAAGIVLVPEDRKRQGLVMTGSVAYNLALPWTRDWIRGCLIDRRAPREYRGQGDARASPSRPPIPSKASAASPAATSRRWSSAGGWSIRPGS